MSNLPPMSLVFVLILASLTLVHRPPPVQVASRPGTGDHMHNSLSTLPQIHMVALRPRVLGYCCIDIPSHFGALSTFSTPHVHQDVRNGPPLHWHGHSYAAAVSVPSQTPIGNASHAGQGYRGHDGRGPDGPEQYQFSLHPVTTTTAQSIPIDPALQHSSDCDQAPFVHPQHRVDHEHRPRPKKPDVRHKPSRKPKRSKGKGKARTVSSDSESDADDARSKPRNGRSGFQNYNKVDKDLLFTTVEELLPTGEKGWKLALEAGWPERTGSSLKAKYQSYTKQKNPTGEGERPHEVQRAHEIEDLINTKGGTWDLDDDSELEDDDHSSDSDEPKVVEPVRSAIARRAASPPLCRPRMSAGDAVNTLMCSLDPAALRARDEACTHHSFERTQFMTLSFQLDGLRNRLSNLQQENSGIAPIWNLPGPHASTKSRAGDLMIARMRGLAAPPTLAVMAGAAVAPHTLSVMASSVLVEGPHRAEVSGWRRCNLGTRMLHPRPPTSTTGQRRSSASAPQPLITTAHPLRALHVIIVPLVAAAHLPLVPPAFPLPPTRLQTPSSLVML
ncbi:hypothetical protein K438DRAFT_1749886 [Mycena galopus ATCC 62051]|nr:hypothetical protein K438DRAFT_1749886 [Mycena galopus ATCC 62051]